MAKRRGIVIAGLAAGAYAYFKNPENRRKATIAFNNAKLKVNDFMESQNLEGFNGSDSASSSASSSSTKPQSDGKSTSVQYVNEDNKKEADTSPGSGAESDRPENVNPSSDS